jgi:hypothetical protein
MSVDEADRISLPALPWHTVTCFCVEFDKAFTAVLLLPNASDLGWYRLGMKLKPQAPVLFTSTTTSCAR